MMSDGGKEIEKLKKEIATLKVEKSLCEKNIFRLTNKIEALDLGISQREIELAEKQGDEKHKQKSTDETKTTEDDL